MFKKIPLILAMVAMLAACEDRKERAEQYYQSALSLLDAGDTERAMLELALRYAELR